MTRTNGPLPETVPSTNHNKILNLFVLLDQSVTENKICAFVRCEFITPQGLFKELIEAESLRFCF